MQPGDDIVKQLRRAFDRSGLSMYRVAKSSGLAYSRVHGILTGDQAGLTVESAAALAAALGMRLELRPIQRGKARGKPHG